MKFSVITINLNNVDGLEKTIQSVISQDFTDYEYIIIDGGSTDGSKETIKKYEKNISFWISEKDKGVYNAMNKGIKHAIGEYLIFMNSGDRFHSDSVLNDINDTKLETDIIMGREFVGKKGPFGFSKKNITMMDLYHRPLQHQATFFKRSLFEKKLYDEEYKIVSDWKFAIQTLVFNNCSFSTTNIIIDDFEGNGLSSNNNRGDYESSKMFNELLPPRIIEDYKHFTHLDEEWVELGHIIYFSRNFKKFIITIVKILLAVRAHISK